MEECKDEVWSWWYFTPEQVDGYWIRCTLAVPHDEHEDEHTGLKWRSGLDSTPSPGVRARTASTTS